jgi:hypothetical protein
MKKLLKLLLVLTLLKGITWSLIIPLWHFPDEQAHFGHIAYLAEGGNPKLHGKVDQNQEIVISEEILGTKRNYQGNNKYTYHPEFRLEYAIDDLNGPQEETIKTINQKERKNFVLRESAYYPHFFYYLSGFVYKVFYQANLFIRVFSIRLFWLFLSLLTVLISFKSARLIFPKDNKIPLIVATLTAFHPMLTFTSSGVTSDNLYNFLFSLVIYFCLKLINQFTWQNVFGLTATLGLGLITKQQFLTAFVIITPIIIHVFIKNKKKTLMALLLTPIIFLIAYLISPEYIFKLIKMIKQGNLPFISLNSPSDQVLPNYQLMDHIIWTIKHTIREVIPWYWGVFNWLGVILPRWVNRVLNRMLILAFIGLIIKVVKLIKAKKITNQVKSLGFIAWVAVSYYFCLLIWDWVFFKNNGFSFGIQGRYYFPTIIAHMILLTVGLNAISKLFGSIISKFLLIVLPLWFVVLNFIALFTVSNAYYDTGSINSFISQASQYKPWFAKGILLEGLLIALGLTTGYYIYQLIFYLISIKSDKSS